MTPQERDLITILLNRLNRTEGHPKDPEADTLIREMAVGRPNAPYSLVQTVLIQDLSLHDAQNRITDLQTQLTETTHASSAPPSFLGGPSFLGAVFGPGEPWGAVRTGNMAPSGLAANPTGLATTPQPGYAPKQGPAAPSPPGTGWISGGGFLRSAAITAAGIAGGALLFEGIQSMFGHHDATPVIGNQAAMPGLGETVLNNQFGADGGALGGGITDEHADAVHDPDLPGSDPAADSGQDFIGNNAS